MTEVDKNKLAQIKQLSNSILALALETNNTEEINRLEQNRKNLIDQFFSTAVNPGDSEEVASVIKEVLNINEKVTLQLEKNKKLLTKDFNKFKTSQKATNAYLSNL